MSAVTADIPLILEKCISSGLLSASFDEDIQSSTNILSNTSSSSWAHFYDLDALDTVLSNVLNSFPDHFLHLNSKMRDVLTLFFAIFFERHSQQHLIQ